MTDNIAGATPSELAEMLRAISAAFRGEEGAVEIHLSADMVDRCADLLDVLQEVADRIGGLTHTKNGNQNIPDRRPQDPGGKCTGCYWWLFDEDRCCKDIKLGRDDKCDTFKRHLNVKIIANTDECTTCANGPDASSDKSPCQGCDMTTRNNWKPKDIEWPRSLPDGLGQCRCQTPTCQHGLEDCGNLGTAHCKQCLPSVMNVGLSGEAVPTNWKPAGRQAATHRCKHGFEGCANLGTTNCYSCRLTLISPTVPTGWAD